MTDRSCSQPSLPGRLPLCAGEALALRARGRPPVHSVDPYSYLVRVPAGGLSGQVLLKQKDKSDVLSVDTHRHRHTRIAIAETERKIYIYSKGRIDRSTVYNGLMSRFGVQYSSSGSPCGCSMRASRFSLCNRYNNRSVLLARNAKQTCWLAMPVHNSRSM